MLASMQFAYAQTADSTNTSGKKDKPGHVKTKFGVFGNITTGITFGFFGKLEEDLKKDELFKQEFSISNLGSQYGGNIFVQIGNRFLIGGGGTGFSYNMSLGATNEREIGQTTMRSQFITGNVGFVLFNRCRYAIDEDTDEYEFKYRMYIFPYLGFGSGKNVMRLSNYFDQELQFGGQSGVVLETAKELDFTANLSILELGIGTRFMKNKKGGLMVGGEIGGYFNLGGGKWKYNDPVTKQDKELTQNVSDVALSGIYFRVTVGGGIMKITEPENVSSMGDAYIRPDRLVKATKTASLK